MSYRGLILGWYHQRNAGDDRFMQVLERWLSGHELIFMSHTTMPPSELLSKVDYVLIGGGSLANQRHGIFVNMRQWIKKHRVRVFTASLTASHHPEVLHELRAIKESGGLIWARDEVTANAIGSSDSVILAPDMAWMYPHPFIDIPRRHKIAINLRPWEKISWSPSKYKKVIEESFTDQAVPWPLCFSHDSDMLPLAKAFPHHISTRPDKEFNPSIPYQVECIAAMRYHALVFSIQACTPVIQIINTKKTDRLMSQIGLNKFCTQLNSPHEIPEIFNDAIAWQSPDKLKAISEQQMQLARDTADKVLAAIESSPPKNVNTIPKWKTFLKNNSLYLSFCKKTKQ